jgi:hypothetical protein
MAYNNLENRVTSVEIAQFTNGTGAGQGLSYSTISLTSGVPHVDQLEVERIFDLDFSVNGSNVQDNISTYDLHRIFLLQKSEYTLNETTSKLTNISITASRAYTIVKAKNANLPAGTQITIPSFINGSEKVIVRRKTLSFDPYVSWTAGTRLTSDQLNFQVQQLLRLNQELIYKLESEYLRVNDISGASAPAFDVANSLDMGNNKIINLATPLASTDAANKNYVDTALTGYVALTGAQTVAGNKTFSSPATFSSAVTLASTLAVTGAVTLSSNAGITGTLTVSGATSLQSTLGVTGVITANAGVVGNASTATALQTARTINGVSFNGTGNITVAAAAGTLTGNTLASNVVSSSLTSVGTLNNLTTSGTTTVPNVKISGTASADVNTLDYYEEGTFSPKYQYLNNSSVWTDLTATYDIQYGRFTRIGNTVYCSMRIRTSTATTVAGTSANYLAITGLPFAPNASTQIASALFGFVGGFSTTNPIPTGIYSESGTRVYLSASSATANAVPVDVRSITAAANGNQIWTSFWYHV